MSTNEHGPAHLCPQPAPGLAFDDAGVLRPAGRESVADAMLIVETYGPWGADLNEAHRRQIVLADEVHRLRHLYEMAVRGRAEMRTALRQERESLEARYMALLKAVADGRAMQPAPPLLVDLGPNASLTGPQREAHNRNEEHDHE